jgi:opacity protein-like surface antigen
MKNITLTIVTAVVLLFSGALHTANAQNPVSFGLKGGINIANLSGDEFEDFDTRTGLTVGAVLDINIPMLPIGIESGIYYTQKGVSFSESIDFFGEMMDFKGKLKLDYIEVPVLAKISLGPPGPLSPHLLVGPYVGFNLNAEFDISSNGESESEDISDDINSTDFGFLAGVGVDFNLGLTKLNIQARYTFGLNDISDDIDSRHRVLSLVAGITF